jgi:Lecithin retinol acyltransferase
VIVARGDAIYAKRPAGFSHWGLDRGDGSVIDFVSATGEGKLASMIRLRPRADFAEADADVRIAVFGDRVSAEESVARAESMIGQCGYDLFSNNCEHFVTWCVTGEHHSAQIDRIWSGAGLFGSTTVAPSVGVDVIAGVGTTPARSAPNLMSGLKTIGGGSAATGIGVVAAAGGALGAGSMYFAFRDRQYLPAEERSARRTARGGAVAGGALGAGGVIYLVGALGVPGYGAAGLSSGLSAVGAPLGGGMAAGLTVSVAAPALLAALLALFLYGLVRWLQSRPDSSPGPAFSAI